MNQLPDKKWVCNVCGFSSTGAEPPESCPQCGTDRDHFEEAHPGAKRYLIIGAGVAGVSAAEAIRRLKALVFCRRTEPLSPHELTATWPEN